MKKLVELSELAYVAYVACKQGITMQEFCEFLTKYPENSVEYIVNCGSCSFYEGNRDGFCKYWKTYGHFPSGFCEHGDDSTKLM